MACAGQQIEIPHRITAATTEQRQGQGVVVALQGDRTTLNPVECLYPDPGVGTLLVRHVKQEHGLAPQHKITMMGEPGVPVKASAPMVTIEKGRQCLPFSRPSGSDLLG